MKTILIDGHSVAYRAFYALPDSLETQEGFPTNVIHGFVMMLRKVVSDLEPENLIVTWDVSRKTFRSDLYKEYKSNRTKSPDIFKVQIPVLRELLDKFNIAQLSMEGYEADDILGSLAKSIASKAFSFAPETPTPEPIISKTALSSSWDSCLKYFSGRGNARCKILLSTPSVLVISWGAWRK